MYKYIYLALIFGILCRYYTLVLAEVIDKEKAKKINKHKNFTLSLSLYIYIYIYNSKKFSTQVERHEIFFQIFNEFFQMNKET